MKKATIMVSLVDESVTRSSREIEREIMEELSKNPSRIPWCREVQKVKVTEA
jgi:hypothetical protein